MVKFLRRVWGRHSKLGKGRRKKQKWKKPTGRHNKMREQERGYPAVVSIGYRGEKKSRGKIQEKKPILVNNIKELERIKQDEIIIVGRIGKKKKIEILKIAKEKKIQVYNANVDKFLKLNVIKGEKK